MASKLKYPLELVEIFNRAFSDKPKEIKDRLRPLLADSQVKLAYGRRVVDEIVKRTKEESIDKNGQKFKPYSPEYKKSLPYEIYGKTDKVNLTLTGEMLASMVPRVRTSLRKVVIEFADQLNNDKAHGNINQHDRDFFGLPQEVEQKILRDLISSESRQRRSQLQEFLFDEVNVSASTPFQETSIGGR